MGGHYKVFWNQRRIFTSLRFPIPRFLLGVQLFETLLITLPLMLSPGPANLVSLVLASRYGSRKIACFQIGVLLIYTATAFAMAFTAEQVDAQFERSTVALQIVGGLFIVYLGWRLMLTDPNRRDLDVVPTLRTGLLLQILNPKYPVVVLTLLAARSNTNNLGTAGVIVAVGTAGLLLYSFAGSLIYRYAPIEKHLRELNVVFGATLCAVGLWIASPLSTT